MVPRVDETVEEHFWARAILQPSGCREWSGYRNRDGYGTVTVSQKVWLTHRFAWTLKHGPIPRGMKVLHRCDNPACSQTEPTEGYPEGHLFIGTQTENMADMTAKGRRKHGFVESITHCPQNHEYTPENTYVYADGRRRCRTCYVDRSRAYRLRKKAA